MKKKEEIKKQKDGKQEDTNGARYFTPVKLAVKRKTVIVTPFGRYQHERLVRGSAAASSMFMRLI
jgi:hypothetical protein